MNRDELIPIAKRVAWFQSPDRTLESPSVFVAQVMVYGTLDDVKVLKRHFGDAAFEAVLDAPPPGIFDARSWAYWNLVTGRDPNRPLPRRDLPPFDP